MSYSTLEGTTRRYHALMRSFFRVAGGGNTGVPTVKTRPFDAG